VSYIGAVIRQSQALRAAIEEKNPEIRKELLQDSAQSVRLASLNAPITKKRVRFSNMPIEFSAARLTVWWWKSLSENLLLLDKGGPPVLPPWRWI